MSQNEVITDTPTTTAAPAALEESYRLCRKISREGFGEFNWVLSNLPRDQRKHVYALVAFLARALEMMDLRVSPIVRRNEWQEWRDNLRDAIRGKECPAELMALVNTVERFEISREYLFDIQSGVDMALRCRQLDSFDQWSQLASRIGGSLMLSAVPVLGFEQSGYEQSAMACGEAIYLTQLLDEMGNGHQKILMYAPRMLARKNDVNLDALNPRKPGLEFARFVRLLVARIEPFFYDGGKIIKYLSFDGKRVLRSMIAVHWQLLMKIKADPDGVLQNQHQLTAKELFQLKFKHLMGLEGGVPVLDPLQEEHSH